MSRYYGNIPCIRFHQDMHIVTGGTQSLCGASYPSIRDGSCKCYDRVVWQELSAVTCKKCRAIYRKQKRESRKDNIATLYCRKETANAN